LGKGKIVAAILGVLLLVGGVTAGVILVQQRQELREKAACTPCLGGTCPDGWSYGPDECSWQPCDARAIEACKDHQITSDGGGEEPSEGEGPYCAICSPADACECDKGTTTGYKCKFAPSECAHLGYTWQPDSSCPTGQSCGDEGEEAGFEYITFECDRCEGLKCQTEPVIGVNPRFMLGNHPGPCSQVDRRPIGSTDGWTAHDLCDNDDWCISPTATPTLPPGITCQCREIKAFDTGWNQLTSEQLGQLQAGDTVYFTVSGTKTSGIFDKARFTINAILRPEVTNKRPGTDEFYDQYQITSTDISRGSISLGAIIHHQELDEWF